MALSSIQLEAFLSVAQTLNFTRAAEKLFITQSALSQRVANLEEELNTTLFIRDRSGIKLTEAAQDLVRYCQMKDHLEAEFVSKISTKKEISGIIRMGGFSSVMRSVILPAITPLIKQNSAVRIHILNKEVYELSDMLRRSEIDYMILPEKLDQNDLECIQLGIEKNVLTQSKNLITNEVYLDHDENDQTTLNYFKLISKKKISLVRNYVDDVYGIIDGVRLGLGKAVLPLHLVKGERNIEILNKNTTLEIPVYLYFYSRPYYTKLHMMLIETLQRNCSQYFEPNT